MKLSVSNIAWEAKDDNIIFRKMKDLGFTGLEIAPTKIISEAPYDHTQEAATFAKTIKENYGFTIPSMQSIWYGIQDKVFGTEAERARLITYTKKAIDFAEAIGCTNLVFGCPRNRAIPESTDSQKTDNQDANNKTTDSKADNQKAGTHKTDIQNTAVSFFRELGDYAHRHHTTIAMEANPPIYHTNYINTTQEAIRLIQTVNSEGFKLNLDVGTMIENNEAISVLTGAAHLINHVHISEPGLTQIKERSFHKELAEFLRAASYKGFVSIETGRRNSKNNKNGKEDTDGRNDENNLNDLFRTMEYVAEIFA